MNKSTVSNVNWGACPKCGEPVLINPSTNRIEPCVCVRVAEVAWHRDRYDTDDWRHRRSHRASL